MMKATRTLLPLLATTLAIGCTAPSATVGPTPAPTPSAAATPTPGPSTAAPAAGFVLDGIVYDDDLAPLAGVSVSAEGASGKGEAVTDAAGKYTMTLPSGSYAVMATKADYVKRTQNLDLLVASTIDFGGQNSLGGNPYFLTDALEIARVEVKEDAPTGPMTLTLELSEPVDEASRTTFTNRFELRTGSDDEFLRGDVAAEPYLRTTATWDETGRIFTFRYAEPYLAGATYIAKLRQRPVEGTDPVTDEQKYEQFNIKDKQGLALGMGRADFAFLQKSLQRMAFQDLGDDDLGYTPAVRRWRLTHTGSFSFNAAADTTPPGLVSAKVDVEKDIDKGLFDVMELRFTEPMRVAKDKDRGQYTVLDKAKELVVVNVSANADGSSPTALGDKTVISDIKFSSADPNVVYLYFASGVFKNKRWVEVTLGPDMKDPSGNKPDPAKLRAAGPVTDPESVKL